MDSSRACLLYTSVYPPLILCDILGLGVALGFVELRTKNADNEKLRQLLELEKKQFEMTRSNVEFVNRNAHDLKHYIHKIQRMEAPEAEELEAVLTKVEAYESAFQTGNATLDIICLLYQSEDTIQMGDFAELPIHYLYVASGNFDFALPGQVQDYQALLDIEPRLRSGVNTCFDVFPMRYHSMGNWHLALYNFLQKIF